MPTTVTVGITASTPVYVYLCDNPITTCVYVGVTSTTPYSFDIPSILEGQTSYNVKLIDSNSCTKIETINLI